jgi:hypothetical protein
MPYRENCKIEGEVLTKIKIARMHLASHLKQKEVARMWRCSKNTVGTIIESCRSAPVEAEIYLKSGMHIPSEKLWLFDFLKHRSRKPKSNKRCFSKDEEQVLLEKHGDLHYGFNRMYKHLKRAGLDASVYTKSKIKGAYKRNKLQIKKVRTASGERRALYDYDKIAAFEFLNYDTKQITDMHALPMGLYLKFKYQKDLPIYQWTIVDVKTKIRFLAWSHSINSFFGLKFLEFVLVWLRAHQVQTKINVQFDGGSEFCSASKRKTASWNQHFEKYDAFVYDTGGAKWKQNIVERTHRIDDEEFYCPRGEFINSKQDFLVEAQGWIIYYNNRMSDSIGLEGITPKEKLQDLGYTNADAICNFPCFILEDYWRPISDFFEIEKSQNVLTPYQSKDQFHNPPSP